MRGPAKTLPARLLEAWLAREDVRVAMGVNTWEGVEYLDGDRFREVLGWAVRLDLLDAPDPAVAAASVRVARRLADAALAAGYRIDRLRATTRAGSAEGVRSGVRRGSAPIRGAPDR
jgi:hypothetical protein